MEEPQRRQEPARDIHELLTNGFYKTSRARSPSSSFTPTNTPGFLETLNSNTNRDRSRSRGPRRPPPPRPTCEDEVDALAKELSSAATLTDDEPPMRGVLEQYPMILEAEVTADERERLHTAPRKDDENDNSERRFVLVPQTDPGAAAPAQNLNQAKEERAQRKRSPSIRETDTKRERRAPASSSPGRQRPEPVREEKKLNIPPAPLQRRGSRQDLPALKTKIEKESPPQFRRTTSAYASTPSQGEMPRPARLPSEYMLSPDVTPSSRGSKGYFDPATQTAPRYSSTVPDSAGSRVNNDKRNSGSSFSELSRPATPRSEKEKRLSGSLDQAQPRRETVDKIFRPQHLSEEHHRHHHHHRHRTASTHSERPRSPPRSAVYNLRNHYSSEDDTTDSSGSERSRRHHREHRQSLRPDDDYDRHRRAPSSSRRPILETKNSARHTSTLYSPKVSPSQSMKESYFEPQRSETIPNSRERGRPSDGAVSPFSPSDETPRASDRLNPMDSTPRARSRSRRRSSVSKAQVSQPSLPIPIPSRSDLYSSGDTRKTPLSPQPEAPKSPIRAEGKSYWQPPPFQPPSSASLEKPVGSYRRYSEDIERGSVVPLPSCPRMNPVYGYYDWLTLRQSPDFRICPSCYGSTMMPSEFRNHFMPAPVYSPGAEVVCDFGSSPWYRIAWLMTLKERRRDLKLLHGLADVAANTQECLGKHEAIRQWYSIIDSQTGQPIKRFDVCYSCVKSIEAILPAIRGIFVPINSSGPSTGICDLRFDSKRFIQYFDAFETTADSANEFNGKPDTRELVALAKELALVEECQRDADLTDRRWYIITQLPDFTVCEECYGSVIAPYVAKRKPIAAMFAKSQSRIPKASCQLYSERMRSKFQEAVETDDYKFLAATARERKGIEMNYKSSMNELKRRKDYDPLYVARESERVQGEWRRWE
ncbi:hypothetical protein BP6252_01208 [Coleophoma cylindrospora]|uniref:Ser arg-related nuclear matrix protein n=1 Tax=Coleophoma cylindrospora TaxID=1849047 RepID=A0A3D8SS84_9HELO|nr:hypothetical protein BP6252_01208 [Coleophoma cylindrospora]